MTAVGIATEPEVTVGTPEMLFDLPARDGFDVADDGRFVMAVRSLSETATYVNVVLNWTEELNRLVPID